jgi:Protein of unknown function (DUF1761)
MPDINWLAAIVAGAVSGLGLGFLWYGPLFGKAWMAASGVSMEEASQRPMAIPVAGSLALSILASIALAFFLGKVDPLTGAVHGLVAGLFLVAGGLGINYLWEGKSLKHWLINGGYCATQFTLIGFILGLWH